MGDENVGQAYATIFGDLRAIPQPLPISTRGEDPYEADFHWLEPEDYTPNPKEPGRILMEIIPGGGSYTDWKILSIEELTGEGGAYEYENEFGELRYALEAGISQSEIDLGWWVVEDFTLHFSRDWEGHYDCDYDFSPPRRATWNDIDHFGIEKLPLWVKIYQDFTGKVLEYPKGRKWPTDLKTVDSDDN